MQISAINLNKLNYIPIAGKHSNSTKNNISNKNTYSTNSSDCIANANKAMILSSKQKSADLKEFSNKEIAFLKDSLFCSKNKLSQNIQKVADLTQEHALDCKKAHEEGKEQTFKNQSWYYKEYSNGNYSISYLISLESDKATGKFKEIKIESNFDKNNNPINTYVSLEQNNGYDSLEINFDKNGDIEDFNRFKEHEDDKFTEIFEDDDEY